MHRDAEDLLEDYQEVTHHLSRMLDQMAAQMGKTIHPTSQERHAVLVHSCIRASRLAKACVLLSGRKFAEEIFALNRGLAEVCVNGAYLQISSAKELENYLTYDPVKMAILAKRMASEMPRREQPSNLEQAKLRDGYSKALPGSSTSWSTNSLAVRASELDKAVEAKALMTPIALFVYEMGHTHVHGTAYSVATVGNWYLDGADEDSEERLMATATALNGSALCLLALSTFVAKRYPLGLDQEITTLRARMNSLGSITK